MTRNTIPRESAREPGWTIFMAAALAAAGCFTTFYSASIIIGLIVQWLAHPY